MISFSQKEVSRKMLIWPDHRTTLISTLSLVKLIKLPMRRPSIFVNSTGIRSNGSQKDGLSKKVDTLSKFILMVAQEEIMTM